MSALISVIIPAYNSEKCIGKCIESIQASLYENLEIIVVNDGSKDNTLEVVKSYAESDGRIVVVDKANGGVSSARNAGLDRASGEYISFIDSDDYVSEDFYSKLIKPCLDGADVSSCKYEMVDLGGNSVSKENIGLTEAVEITPKQIAADYFTYLDYGIINFACGKLFRRNVVGDVRFSTTLKWGEDGSFNLDVFRKMNRLAYVPKTMYFYVIYPGQTTSKRMPGYADMMVQHIGDIDRYIKEYGGYENECVRAGMGRTFLAVIKNTSEHCLTAKEYRRDFYKLKQQEWARYLTDAKKMTFRWRLAYFFVKCNMPVGLYLMTKIYSKISKIKREKEGKS